MRCGLHSDGELLVPGALLAADDGVARVKGGAGSVAAGVEPTDTIGAGVAVGGLVALVPLTAELSIPSTFFRFAFSGSSTQSLPLTKNLYPCVPEGSETFALHVPSLPFVIATDFQPLNSPITATLCASVAL